MKTLQLCIASALMAAPAVASAHIRLTSHASRYGDEQKSSPCGRTGGERGSNVYTYAPGETITVAWDEYINHPGHFRVAFDADGDDDLLDPASPDDSYTNDAVLLDDIPDASGSYAVEITLPDVECDQCTLQVIQLMTDKLGNGYGNDDVYHRCVDLVLTRDGAPAGPDAGADPGPGPKAAEGGCRVAADAGSGSGLLLLFAMAALRRRRGRRSANAHVLAHARDDATVRGPMRVLSWKWNGLRSVRPRRRVSPLDDPLRRRGDRRAGSARPARAAADPPAAAPGLVQPRRR